MKLYPFEVVLIKHGVVNPLTNVTEEDSVLIAGPKIVMAINGDVAKIVVARDIDKKVNLNQLEFKVRQL